MKRAANMLAAVIVCLTAISGFAQDPFYYWEFDEGLGTWWVGFESGQADGVYEIDTTPDWLSGDASLMIEIIDGGSSNWHVQALDHINSLVSGTSYDVYFMAATDASGPVNCDVIWSLPVDPWTNYQQWDHQIDPDPQSYGPFTWVAEADGQIDLKFWLGGNDPVVVWLDSVVVVETPENAVGGCCPDDPAAAPEGFALEQNYPNPFNPSTTIPYRLAEPADVTLNVYNLEGRHVRTLVQGSVGAGANHAAWDGMDMHGQPAASGVYIYRLDARGPVRNFSASNKMFLIK